MTKYLIQINESQRRTFLEALMLLGHDIRPESADLGPMLRDLPEDEASDPGTIHDFTA